MKDLKRQRLFAYFITILLPLVFVSCWLNFNQEPFVGIKIDRDRISFYYLAGPMPEGELLPHIADILAQENEITIYFYVNPNIDQVVIWSTSDPNVATVRGGVVTAVGVGRAVITAATIVGGFTAECEVTVTAVVFYSQFGAAGDGKTCDFDAIKAAHAEANNRVREGQPALVRADPGFIYYIADLRNSLRIETDIDWRDAYFIVNDAQVDRIFYVTSTYAPLDFSDVPAFNRNAARVNVTLPQSFTPRALVRATTGTSQQETGLFIINRNGHVDPENPVLLNFANVSSFRTFPIDERTLTIRGGTFTIAGLHNMGRGIYIDRSNMVIDGINYLEGVILVENTTNVTIRNSKIDTDSIAVNDSINFSLIPIVNGE